MRQVYKKCDVCNEGSVPHFDFEHSHTAGNVRETGTCLYLSLCTKCNGKGYIETDLFVEDSPTDEFGLTDITPFNQGANHV